MDYLHYVYATSEPAWQCSGIIGGLVWRYGVNILQLPTDAQARLHYKDSRTGAQGGPPVTNWGKPFLTSDNRYAVPVPRAVNPDGSVGPEPMWADSIPGTPSETALSLGIPVSDWDDVAPALGQTEGFDPTTLIYCTGEQWGTFALTIAGLLVTPETGVVRVGPPN